MPQKCWAYLGDEEMALRHKVFRTRVSLTVFSVRLYPSSEIIDVNGSLLVLFVAVLNRSVRVGIALSESSNT